MGLLPAALQGIDIDAMRSAGAAPTAIAATRGHETLHNPAALLALMWYAATDGKGKKDMVVLPYKDRLLLFSRYLQQLVMESLGKRLDLDGKKVEQGIAVYGNKGSTDQHAYLQQLRDGVNNFFVTFIRVLESGGAPVEVEPGVTAGDYLHGFLVGTREALYGNDRQSMTITIRQVNARTVGALIALFERAVGLYASLIRINAYNQPGVEAGKKAAADGTHDPCRQRRKPLCRASALPRHPVCVRHRRPASPPKRFTLSSNTCLPMAGPKWHAPRPEQQLSRACELLLSHKPSRAIISSGKSGSRFRRGRSVTRFPGWLGRSLK